MSGRACVVLNTFQNNPARLAVVHQFRVCTHICCCQYWGGALSCMLSAHMVFSFIVFRVCVCRARDYWQGYKLFCYAYYSHSALHESEFRQSKLGSCTTSTLFGFIRVLGLGIELAIQSIVLSYYIEMPWVTTIVPLRRTPCVAASCPFAQSFP